MKFDNINSNTSCNCMKEAEMDVANEYVRKLRKSSVEDKDFMTHWEREIRPKSEACEEICSYNGVSINQFKAENENQILNKYKTTFSINPKKGAYYLRFRLNDDAGKVKFAPDEDDRSHYNLFKADGFNLEKILIIETVKFA